MGVGADGLDGAACELVVCVLGAGEGIATPAADWLTFVPSPDANPSKTTTAPTRSAAMNCSRRYGLADAWMRGVVVTRHI